MNKNTLLSVNHQRVLALFESESRITTNEVVKKLKIPRPTAKQILSKLTDLDLLDQKGSGRASYYTIKQETEILDPHGKQLVSVYRGMKSFESLFERLSRQLKSGDFYWAFAFKNEYSNSIVRDLLLNFHKDLSHKQIDDRVIASKEVENIVRSNFNTVSQLKLRFTTLDIPVGIIIIQDTVINLVWGEQPLAIVIKAPEIYKRYQSFFLEAWDNAADNTTANELPKPGNTQLVSLANSFGVKNLWMKDEVQNPTHTFKDRLAYEMVRPLLEKFRGGRIPEPVTFGSISYGNTAKAMGYYVSRLNEIVGREIATSIAFIPPSLTSKKFGPDVEGKHVSASSMLDNIKKDSEIVEIDLKKQYWGSKELEQEARKEKKLKGSFINITEGLNRPAYVNIIIEAIEQQLKKSPDYVIVPFGAGILCNEIIDYINDYKLHTKVIPVSSGDPDTIAVMLYGPIWVDVKSLGAKGWGWTRHEDPDLKGRKREQYKVYHVTDKEIISAMKELRKKNVLAEPSGASGFAILPRLHKIDPAFDPKKHSVLIINTGDGLLNYE